VSAGCQLPCSTEIEIEIEIAGEILTTGTRPGDSGWRWNGLSAREEWRMQQLTSSGLWVLGGVVLCSGVAALIYRGGCVVAGRPGHRLGQLDRGKRASMHTAAAPALQLA